MVSRKIKIIYIWQGLEGSSAGASVPSELGVSPSWHAELFTVLEALWALCFGDFMEASSRGMIDCLLHFCSLTPNDGEWDRKFQASNQSLVFLVTSPHPEAIQDPTQSCLIRTNDSLMTQEIPRGWGLRPIYIYIYFLLFYKYIGKMYCTYIRILLFCEPLVSTTLICVCIYIAIYIHIYISIYKCGYGDIYIDICVCASLWWNCISNSREHSEIWKPIDR